MQELTFSPATIILLAIILVGVFFALRRLHRRGACDCDDHCGDCGHKGTKSAKGAASSCPHCQAADDMVSAMSDAAKK